MTSLHRLVWVCGVFVGCAPFAVGNEGGGGGFTNSATSASVSSVSVSNGSASTTTTSTTTTTAQSTSSGTTAGGAFVYTRTVDATQWARVPVEVYWPDVNAPPSTGITAVADLQKFEDLFVFAWNGTTTTVHRKIGDVWRDPAPLSTYFPLLPDTAVVESAIHVPYWSAANMQCGAVQYPNNESIRLIMATGDVWDFDVDPSGFIFELPNVDNPMSWTTGLYGGPALPAWILEVVPNPDLCGTLGWYINYALMGGRIYFADGRLVDPPGPTPMFFWEELPLSGGANPIFVGGLNEPDPTTLVAAFYERSSRTFGFVGP